MRTEVTSKLDGSEMDFIGGKEEDLRIAPYSSILCVGPSGLGKLTCAPKLR